MDEDEPAAVPGQDHQADESPFRSPPRRPLLQRIVPVAEHLPGYRGRTLGRDALAGVTVAALALPAAMAYAELAGRATGHRLVHTAAAGRRLRVPRLLPSADRRTRRRDRRHGRRGSDPDDPRSRRTRFPGCLLALLVGAAYLAALLARLGWIADYLSRPVLIGYLQGVAIVMIVGQLGKLLGLSISAETPPGQVIEAIRELGQVSWPPLLWAAICLVLLLLGRWLIPKLPAALIVVALTIAASAALGLAAYGVASRGDIPAGLPSIACPTSPANPCSSPVPAALGIFFVSFSDEILVARSFAGRRGQHVRADAELAGMGAASLAASISQGFPVGASGSRTAVNDQMGGRTQISGLIAAGVVALVLLFLTAPDAVPAQGGTSAR